MHRYLQVAACNEFGAQECSASAPIRATYSLRYDTAAQKRALAFDVGLRGLVQWALFSLSRPSTAIHERTRPTTQNSNILR